MSPTEPHLPSAKRAVLAHALQLFASRGVEAVSVRDIAAATGFTNPALFRHFPTKDALARALFEQSYARLVAALVAAEDAHGLEAWLTALLREIAAAPDAAHFVMGNLKLYFATLPEALKARNLPLLVRRKLEAEREAGRLRADLDVPLTVTLLLGALGQIARSAHFHESVPDPEPLAARMAGLFLRGIGAG